MTERKTQNIFYIVIIILLIPALFVNVGKMPLTSDEPTRAVVALEMNLSGNYITPTIHGDYYLCKPPFYNWLLAGLFKLTNSESEFIIRLPALISLLGFALTIFFFVKKHLSEKTGLITALMFITSGRILFYDSQLGLIDLFFSWLTFTGFIVIYHYFNKQKYSWLFILSYLITAVGVLTKGLPSFLFQGITLLVVFLYKKQFKKLFHWSHFLGIIILFTIVGGYFWLYSRHTFPLPYLKSLLYESTQRTPLEHGIWSSIIHLFIFPVEQLYYILPWSLLLILLFRKGLFKKVWEHPFIKYCLLIFISNILVYWISPSTLPRYIFMLYPLLLIFMAQLYSEADNITPRLKQILLYILIYSAILVVIAGLVIFYIVSAQFSISLILKLSFLIVALAISAYLMFKMVGYRIILFAIILLVLRIGFNWFVIPYRCMNSPEVAYKKSSIKVAQLTYKEKIYICEYTPVDHANVFYIEREKRDILIRTYEPLNKKTYYILYSSWLPGLGITPLYEFYAKPDQTPISLIKID